MESLDLRCRRGGSFPPKICALLLPTWAACTFRLPRLQRKKLRAWPWAKHYLRRPAAVVTEAREPATDPQPAPLRRRQQTFTLRSRQSKELGKLWKKACQAQRWRHGRANSAKASGTPWL